MSVLLPKLKLDSSLILPSCSRTITKSCPLYFFKQISPPSFPLTHKVSYHHHLPKAICGQFSCTLFSPRLSKEAKMVFSKCRSDHNTLLLKSVAFWIKTGPFKVCNTPEVLPHTPHSQFLLPLPLLFPPSHSGLLASPEPPGWLSPLSPQLLLPVRVMISGS